SPQWRKGPRCKPVLCNACGTRFLRTRSLGKVRNTKAKVREQSRFAEASLDDMMDEDAEADYPAGTAHGWGALVKHDSLVHEQDNVSSSTTVPGMNMGFGVPAAMPGCDFHATEEHHMMALTQHEDCASAAGKLEWEEASKVRPDMRVPPPSPIKQYPTGQQNIPHPQGGSFHHYQKTKRVILFCLLRTAGGLL
ncbi:MAG: hypothetical protein FRX49_13807, partial [Trebouxia sp. A1-2]